MPITPITNHIDQGLSRLISRFRNRPRFAAWCASHLRQSQLFEDACWELVDALDVDTADLPRLTLLGKIVGQTPRGTLEQFRSYVKVRVLVNRSRATAPVLIKIATILLGPIAFTRGTASITIVPDEIDASIDTDYVAVLLRLAKGAGVRLELIYTFTPENEAFSFAPGTVSLTDGRGFASTTVGTDGGYLASIR
jgi:hypothetical protein